MSFHNRAPTLAPDDGPPPLLSPSSAPSAVPINSPFLLTEVPPLPPTAACKTPHVSALQTLALQILFKEHRADITSDLEFSLLLAQASLERHLKIVPITAKTTRAYLLSELILINEQQNTVNCMFSGSSQKHSL